MMRIGLRRDQGLQITKGDSRLLEMRTGRKKRRATIRSILTAKIMEELTTLVKTLSVRGVGTTEAESSIKKTKRRKTRMRIMSTMMKRRTKRGMRTMRT